MSGGIRYRLTPAEHELFGQYFTDPSAPAGSLAELRATLKQKGLEIRTADPDMNVIVEEEKGEIRFSVIYPLDSDANPQNGRLFLQDDFVLSSKDQSLLQHDRSFSFFRPGMKKIKLWEERMETLKGVPMPELKDPELQRFSREILQKLHRPLPKNIPALLEQGPLFKELRSILNDHRVAIRPSDPQSGIQSSLEGNKLKVKLTLVLDDDPKEGLAAESNGRLYLEDNFEIDIPTRRVLRIERNFRRKTPLSRSMSDALEDLKNLPDPRTGNLDLQSFAETLLLGLEIPPPPPLQPNQAKPIDAGLSQRILQQLFELTDKPSRFEARTLFAISTRQAPVGSYGLIKDDLARQALHDAADLLLRQDPQAPVRIRRWIEEQPLAPEFIPLLRSLSALSQNRLDEAWSWVQRADNRSSLKRQVERLVLSQILRKNALQGLQVLTAYTLEKTAQQGASDKAWGNALWRGITGESALDVPRRRQAADRLFEKVGDTLWKQETSLEVALKKIKLVDPDEIALRDQWLTDRTVGELMDICKNPDSVTRHRELIFFAEQRLLMDQNLSESVKAILEAIPEGTPGADRLRNYFAGRASFGQKLEMLGPRFIEEAASPTTIASMIFAGGIASLGKFTFLSRLGAETRALRLGSEATALGLEAPAFLASDKVLRSFWISPEGQWDHPFKDLGGAYLAFGTLRGLGLATQGLNEYWAELPALKKFAEGSTRWATAERLVPVAERFGTWGESSAGWLKSLAKDGVSRRWVLPALQGSTTHLLSPAALVLTNSLSRSLGLMRYSSQGWKGNVTDDLLMYGHFVVAGSLAHRIGVRPLDPYNRWMEVQGKEQLAGNKSVPVEKAADPEPASKKISKIGVTLQGLFQALRKIKIGEKAKAGDGESPSQRETWRQRIPESFRRFLERFDAWKSNDPKESGGPPESAPGTRDGATSAKLPDSETPVSQTAPSTEIAVDRISLPPESVSSGSAPAPAQGMPTAERPLPEAKPEPLEELTQPPLILNPSVPVRHVEPPIPEGVRPLAFHLPKAGKEENPVWVLGNRASDPSGETPAEFMLGQGVDLPAEPFAKLTRMKSGLPSSPGPGWNYFIENLKAPGGTFVNELGISNDTPLQSGDVISFEGRGPTLLFQQNSKTGAGLLVQSQIGIGRISKAEKLPEVLFPSSERHVSRNHARIWFDSKTGNYLIQDTSDLGTIIQRSGQAPLKVYRNSQMTLKDGDDLLLGAPEGHGDNSTLTFHLPELKLKSWPPEGREIPLPSEISSPPPAAARHPVFRGSSPEKVQTYLETLGEKLQDGYMVRQTEDETLYFQIRVELETGVPYIEANQKSPAEFNFDIGKDLSNDIAFHLVLDHGREIALLTDRTSWVLGPDPKIEGDALAIPLGSRAKAEAILYLDPEGRLILQERGSGEGVFVELYNDGSGKPLLQRIKGWTVLQGNERLYLGKDGMFVDLENGTPNLPYQPPATRSEGLLITIPKAPQP